MEITPRKGIGEFTFGMTEADVIAKLGKPDKSYEEDDEDEEQLVYQYNKLKLRLTFYMEHGGRLGYIRSANPALTYQGKQLINKPIDTITEGVFASLVQTWKVEDYEFFVTYFTEEYWVVLNTEYDEVTDVELGVPFKNDEEYDWG